MKFVTVNVLAVLCLKTSAFCELPCQHPALSSSLRPRVGRQFIRLATPDRTSNKELEEEVKTLLAEVDILRRQVDYLEPEIVPNEDFNRIIVNAPGNTQPQPPGTIESIDQPPKPIIESYDDGPLQTRDIEVWRQRSSLVYGIFRGIVEEKIFDANEKVGEDETSSTKRAFVASAVSVVIGALVLRLGGRAALMSVLGLDMVADMGINSQIDQALAYSNALGGWSVVAFFLAWAVAKTFLVDFLSIALALSAGILFGGVVQGALMSASGATAGSLVAFTLSRTLLRDKTVETVQSQPMARALAKVVEKDSFKTVFVLRLAPVLPLPIGAYSYIYGGLSNISALVFAPATFLGSLKPYLLDSYLGIFSKSMMDNPGAMDTEKEGILLLGLALLVLVGVFASDLAGESFEQISAEMEADAKLNEGKNATETVSGSGDKEEGGFFGLPSFSWNTVFPQETLTEAEEVWTELNLFMDHQWESALSDGLKLNATETEGGGNDMGLQELLTGGGKKQDEIKAYQPDELTAQEKAELSRRARWVQRGEDDGQWRSAMASLFFSFSLAKALGTRLTERTDFSELNGNATEVPLETSAIGS